MLISAELCYLIRGCRAEAVPNILSACCPLIIMCEKEVEGFGDVLFMQIMLRTEGEVELFKPAELI